MLHVLLCGTPEYSVFAPNSDPRLWRSLGVDLSSSLLSLGQLVQLPDVWLLLAQYIQILLFLPVSVDAWHICVVCDLDLHFAQ